MYAISCAVFFADGVAPGEAVAGRPGRRASCRRTRRRSGCSGRAATPFVQFGRVDRRDRRVGDRELAADRVGLRAGAVRAERAPSPSPRRRRGRLASATGAPLTGFSGTGGLNVVGEGAACPARPPGPASAGSPRRCAGPTSRSAPGRARGVVREPVERRVEDAERVVDDVAVLIEDAAAPTSRTPAPSRRFGCSRRGCRAGMGRCSESVRRRSGPARPSPCTRFEETVSPDISHRRAGGHAHAVLAEERPRRGAAAAAGSGSRRPMPGSCRRSRSGRRHWGRCSSGTSCGR